MEWIQLTSEEQLHQIVDLSRERSQVIFKHSTRCSLSSVAWKRVQSGRPNDMDFYILDLIAYRSLSNRVAEVFKVHHESPQVLVIKDGECIYDESHLGISIDDILEQTKIA
ncbi:MAG TPA: bacillithiol system redox-active protein YtxJ [Chitinophagaceae bacterium]|nr:bacillithiol system redox-active protein YtxJ [Chitinophagaceae bacterium]